MEITTYYAPSLYNPAVSVFLAGSITGCPDWQTDFIKLLVEETGKEPLLSKRKLNILNPRRPQWNRDAGEDVIKEQILWEHKYLLMCDFIVFWFAKETLAPITLFELGKMLTLKERANIIIGTHPEYARRLDVIVQSRLLAAAPVSVKSSLEEVADALIRRIGHEQVHHL